MMIQTNSGKILKMYFQTERINPKEIMIYMMMKMIFKFNLKKTADFMNDFFINIGPNLLKIITVLGILKETILIIT